ncbi:SPW repeat protein [Rhizobium leguminosarum]|uniref:SPW repeat protein n=1 Tax=Rhizobium leguminosarum TaxID=384 RepID=UPI001C9661C3|nr:SPW repeat protein [Rhizobium leguminosarum]MBY5639330.1 SPW repeat protein [Rhizobium leguminosarum]MBY5690417.1 SPW repeat protein [Rhizobium leguminosarum]
MMKSQSSKDRAAFDIINIVGGLALFLSPWLLGFATEAYAAWNAWIVGLAIAVIAAAALFAFYEAEEWINLVLGVWALVAPWVLGFSAVGAAMWAHLIAGIVVAVLAAGSIWFTHNHPLSTT